MPKRNYKLSTEQAQAISEARAGDEFQVEFTKRADVNGKEILVLCYSHQPTPVSQYHHQPREYRIAIFRDRDRIADWIVSS